MTSSSCLIARLLQFRRPTTIPRFVVPVVVDTVKGILSAWPWTHIGGEVIERRAPTFTHANTARTVVPISLMGRLVTTSDHRIPTAVCDVAGLATARSTTSQCFAANAATTQRAAKFQRLARTDDCRPAITLAQPFRATAVETAGVFDYEQTAKSLASHINTKARLSSHRALLSRGVRPAAVSPARRSSVL